MAQYLNTVETPNDTPPAPKHGDFRPKGAFRRWYRARLNAYNRRNTHLWFSWLQCKRAAEPLSEELVEDTYQDHFATLSSPDSGDPELIDRIMSNPVFEEVLDKVRNDIRKNSPDYASVEGRTSFSACFESTRKTAGQHGYLCGLVGVNEHDLLNRELVWMLWLPVAYVRGKRMTNVLAEFKGSFAGAEKWGGLRNGIDSWCDENDGEPVKALIQAVLEPLKVRVISKGEALPYYMSRGLQKAMHDSMRNMPCFRLIGRALSPTDLIDLRRKEWTGDDESHREDNPDWAYHSVDYKSSTDGLSWNYSRRIFDRVVTGSSEAWQTLWRQVLGPHALFYPVRWDDGTVSAEFAGIQQNGQLMGGILSFVFLCLCHLGLILEVLGQRGRDLRILDEILINGDDGLYRGTQEEWDRHVELGADVGLKMSVGKAYRHTSFANINSTCFHCHRGNDVTEIPFLNTGLILGQSKVLNKAKDASTLAESCEKNLLIPNLNEILRGSLKTKQRDLLRYVFKLRKDDLLKESLTEVRVKGKKVAMTRNLFIHESFGGLGVRCPEGWHWSISSLQLRLAYSLLEQIDARVSFGLPLPGYDMALSVKRSPFDKTILDLQERDFGRLQSHGKESKRFFQIGFLPWVSHPLHVDATEFAIVHGVSAYRPSKTVPFDELWYTSVDQTIHCREWLNSSVLNAPSLAEKEYRQFLKVLTPLRRKRSQIPNDDCHDDGQREAEAVFQAQHLMSIALRDRLASYQRDFDFSLDARALIEKTLFAEAKSLVHARFKNRSVWLPQA